MGKHALSIYVLVISNILVIGIQGFYWKSPKNNIVSTKQWSYFLFMGTGKSIISYNKPGYFEIHFQTYCGWTFTGALDSKSCQSSKLK